MEGRRKKAKKEDTKEEERELFANELSSRNAGDAYLVETIRGMFKASFVDLCMSRNLFQVLCDNCHFNAARELGKCLGEHKVNWRRLIDKNVSEDLANFGHLDGAYLIIYRICIDEYEEHGIIEARYAQDARKLLARHKREEWREEISVGGFLDASAETTQTRKCVVLCLCAHRFDCASWFSKLPRDLVAWILRRYVWDKRQWVSHPDFL